MSLQLLVITAVDENCHSLHYYIHNVSQFPFDVIFIFLDGEHVINVNDILQLTLFNKLKFYVQDQWVHNFHWIVMQSTVIIRCVNKVVTVTSSITDCHGEISIGYNLFNHMHPNI